MSNKNARVKPKKQRIRLEIRKAYYDRYHSSDRAYTKPGSQSK